MKSLAFTALLIFSSPAAFAGTFIGNGGDIVMINGKMTLLDFFENGISADRVPCDSPAVSTIPKGLRKTLDLDSADLECLSSAIDNLAAGSRFLADGLVQALVLHEWVLVQGEMIESPVALTYQKPKGLRVRTVANRHLETIRISASAWKKMKPLDRAGLIVHEALYSLLAVECQSDRCSQNARVARDLTARIFRRPQSPNDLHLWRESLAMDWSHEGAYSATFYSYTDLGDVKKRGLFLSAASPAQPTREQLVRQLYKSVLGRSASHAEAYWWTLQSLRQDAECSELTRIFLASKEYTDRVDKPEAPSIDRICRKFEGGRQS